MPGYLSLHQTVHSLTIKWTPNQLMNGYSEAAEEKDKRSVPLQGLHGEGWDGVEKETFRSRMNNWALRPKAAIHCAPHSGRRASATTAVGDIH